MSIRGDIILVPSQILCTVHPRRTTQILVAILPRLALANANAGDLDGDTFFVCWDEGLVPPRTVAPADYSGTAEQVFGSISPKDMVHHFAFSDQASRRSSIQVLISYLCAINILMEEDARQNQLHQGIHIAALSYSIQFHQGIIADQACDSLSLSLCVPVKQTTLGRLNNLFMRWADARGASCGECLQISDLFSRGVDSVKTGEVLRIPEHLKNCPENYEQLGGHQCTFLFGRRATRMEQSAAQNQSCHAAIFCGAWLL